VCGGDGQVVTSYVVVSTSKILQIVQKKKESKKGGIRTENSTRL
jgi:hypothetical protein